MNTTTSPDGINILEVFRNKKTKDEKDEKHAKEVEKQLKLLNDVFKRTGAGKMAGTGTPNMRDDGVGYGARVDLDKRDQFRTLGVRAKEFKNNVKDFLTPRGFLDKTGLLSRGSGGLISEHLDKAEYEKQGFVGAAHLNPFKKEEQPGKYSGWMNPSSGGSVATAGGSSLFGGSEETQNENKLFMDQQTVFLKRIADNTAKMAEAFGLLDKNLKKSGDKEESSGSVSGIGDLFGKGKGILGKAGGALKRAGGGLLKGGATLARSAGGSLVNAGASIAKSGIGGKLLTGAKGFGVGSVLGIGGDIAADYLGRDTKAGAGADTLGQAASYAGTGALIGSVVPGVGTAIGGAVGGAIGLGKGIYDNWSTLFGSKNSSPSVKDASSADAGKGYTAIGKDGKMKSYDTKADLLKAQKSGEIDRASFTEALKFGSDKKSSTSAGASPSMLKTTSPAVKAQRSDLVSLGEMSGEYTSSAENVESTSSSIGSTLSKIGSSITGLFKKKIDPTNVSKKSVSTEDLGSGKLKTTFEDKTYEIRDSGGTTRYDADGNVLFKKGPSFMGVQNTEFANGSKQQDYNSGPLSLSKTTDASGNATSSAATYDLGLAVAKTSQTGDKKSGELLMRGNSDNAALKQSREDTLKGAGSTNVSNTNVNNNMTQVTKFDLPTRKDDSSLNRYTGSRLAY